jgi:hypothetical protein
VAFQLKVGLSTLAAIWTIIEQLYSYKTSKPPFSLKCPVCEKRLLPVTFSPMFKDLMAAVKK